MYTYNSRFYNWIDTMTQKDAEIITTQIINWLRPKSVVDFGCGEGLWLKAIKEMDKDISILGLDGEYINPDRMQIPSEFFRPVDLSKPINLGSKFDLAISTEVAEHIEEKESDIFINNITSAADNILFTAAVPGQGGINHINEQWQSYWIEKFKKRGYFVDLSVRNFFWNNRELTNWRRQNLLFFSKREDRELIAWAHTLYDVAHPENIERLLMELRKIKDDFSYCISNPDIYKKIDNALMDVIGKYNNIIIYPYGRNGRMCKMILNNRYNRKELAVIDNIACRNDIDVLPVEALRDINGSYVVIDTCSNFAIHREVQEQLRHFVNEENIYTVFTEQ